MAMSTAGVVSLLATRRGTPARCSNVKNATTRIAPTGSSNGSRCGSCGLCPLLVHARVRRAAAIGRRDRRLSAPRRGRAGSVASAASRRAQSPRRPPSRRARACPGSGVELSGSPLSVSPRRCFVASSKPAVPSRSAPGPGPGVPGPGRFRRSSAAAQRKKITAISAQSSRPAPIFMIRPAMSWSSSAEIPHSFGSDS